MIDVTCGRGATRTRNVRWALIGGAPSSVTRTVIRLVPGVWAGVGRQEKRPLDGLIDAPEGAPGSRLKVRFCGGASLSVAVILSSNNWLSMTTWSARLSTNGGVFAVSRKLTARGVGVVSVKTDPAPSG